MRDVMDDLLSWWAAGEGIGMATVVRTFQSAPRAPGATMLVGPRGVVVGSVSGGCVEASVFELATEVLGSGTPVLQRFGVTDNDALAVGLTCGGTIEVFIERIDRDGFPHLDVVVEALRSKVPVAVATCIEAPESVGSVRAGHRTVVLGNRSDRQPGSAGLDTAVADRTRELLARGVTGILRIGADGRHCGEESVYFVSSFAPPPRMVVFGATNFAKALVGAGRFLGYDVTVCDARALFTTSERFPDADQVVVDWPHRYLQAEVAAGRVDDRTVICTLAHDARFEIPLLECALRLPVAYVGAMGSRRVHDDRLQQLRAAGLDAYALARLHSPIGLDLGAVSPEETAISIAAEIIANRHGGSAEPLSRRAGPIHELLSSTH
jgi:xanthine dehydrogenase accessory factor